MNSFTKLKACPCLAGNKRNMGPHQLVIIALLLVVTGHELVLQRDGATRAHIALYSTGRPARGQFKKTLCGSASCHWLCACMLPVDQSFDIGNL